MNEFVSPTNSHASTSVASLEFSPFTNASDDSLMRGEYLAGEESPSDNKDVEKELRGTNSVDPLAQPPPPQRNHHHHHRLYAACATSTKQQDQQSSCVSRQPEEGILRPQEDFFSMTDLVFALSSTVADFASAAHFHPLSSALLGIVMVAVAHFKMKRWVEKEVVTAISDEEHLHATTVEQCPRSRRHFELLCLSAVWNFVVGSMVWMFCPPNSWRSTFTSFLLSTTVCAAAALLFCHHQRILSDMEQDSRAEEVARREDHEQQQQPPAEVLVHHEQQSQHSPLVYHFGFPAACILLGLLLWASAAFLCPIDDAGLEISDGTTFLRGSAKTRTDSAKTGESDGLADNENTLMSRISSSSSSRCGGCGDSGTSSNEIDGDSKGSASTSSGNSNEETSDYSKGSEKGVILNASLDHSAASSATSSARTVSPIDETCTDCLPDVTVYHNLQKRAYEFLKLSAWFYAAYLLVLLVLSCTLWRGAGFIVVGSLDVALSLIDIVSWAAILLAFVGIVSWIDYTRLPPPPLPRRRRPFGCIFYKWLRLFLAGFFLLLFVTSNTSGTTQSSTTLHAATEGPVQVATFLKNSTANCTPPTITTADGIALQICSSTAPEARTAPDATESTAIAIVVTKGRLVEGAATTASWRRFFRGNASSTFTLKLHFRFLRKWRFKRTLASKALVVVHNLDEHHGSSAARSSSNENDNNIDVSIHTHGAAAARTRETSSSGNNSKMYVGNGDGEWGYATSSPTGVSVAPLSFCSLFVAPEPTRRADLCRHDTHGLSLDDNDDSDDNKTRSESSALSVYYPKAAQSKSEASTPRTGTCAALNKGDAPSTRIDFAHSCARASDALQPWLTQCHNDETEGTKMNEALHAAESTKGPWSYVFAAITSLAVLCCCWLGHKVTQSKLRVNELLQEVTDCQQERALSELALRSQVGELEQQRARLRLAAAAQAAVYDRQLAEVIQRADGLERQLQLANQQLRGHSFGGGNDDTFGFPAANDDPHDRERSPRLTGDHSGSVDELSTANCEEVSSMQDDDAAGGRQECLADLKAHRAAIQIQRIVRGHQGNLATMKISRVQIQTAINFFALEEFAELITAVNEIWVAILGHRAGVQFLWFMTELARLNKTAVQIQRVVRARQERLAVLKARAVIRIQCAIRGRIAVQSLTRLRRAAAQAQESNDDDVAESGESSDFSSAEDSGDSTDVPMSDDDDGFPLGGSEDSMAELQSASSDDDDDYDFPLGGSEDGSVMTGDGTEGSGNQDDEDDDDDNDDGSKTASSADTEGSRNHDTDDEDNDDNNDDSTAATDNTNGGDVLAAWTGRKVLLCCPIEGCCVFCNRFDASNYKDSATMETCVFTRRAGGLPVMGVPGDSNAGPYLHNLRQRLHPNFKDSDSSQRFASSLVYRLKKHLIECHGYTKNEFANIHERLSDGNEFLYWDETEKLLPNAVLPKRV